MSHPGEPPSDVPGEGWVRRVRRALLCWYDTHARDLPWRGEADPYRIWVSEVMLQQTRVDTVLGYYGTWLERFPDVDTLAAADRDEVLMAWQGLGYYRRARALHDGARLVRERHDGRVPDTYAGLREIPGLGEYAAGAVASIAFGRVVPAVDGNVRRVLARLLDVADPKPAWLRDTAAALVDAERPGDWNQALMELGATVCSPRGPLCRLCPVAAECAARAAGTQEERPVPVKRGRVRSETFVTAVLADEQGRVRVERRPEGGLLGGMWSFPDAPLEGWDDVVVGARALAFGGGGQAASDGSAESDVVARTLPTVRHRYSHLDATYRPVLLRRVRHHPDAESGTGSERDRDRDRRRDARRVSGQEPVRDLRWIDPDEPDVPLPVAQVKIAASAAEALRDRGVPASTFREPSPHPSEGS